MPIREFLVNVPNPTDNAVAPTLRLERVPDSQLRALGYDLPPGELKIRSTRIRTNASSSTLAGCLDAIRAAVRALLSWLLRRPIGPIGRPLTTRLRAQESTEVRVRVDAAGAGGAAAVHLADWRNGALVGGVTLVVVAGPIPVHEGIVEPENPCPIVLAEAPFWLPLDSEWTVTRPVGPIPAGYAVALVAPVTNPTNDVIQGAVAYLEHLGTADVEFRPATWHLGDLAPGATFPLQWRISPGFQAEGSTSVSIVVSSAGFEAVRLRPVLEFGRFGDLGAMEGTAAARPA